MNLKRRMAAFLCLALLLSISHGILYAGKDMESTAAFSDVGNNEKKYIAITFDDGPKAGTTDILLQGLRERGVHATFFLIGKQIEDNEEIIRQMSQDGHMIGNHTFSHVNLSQLSADDALVELGRCFDEIQEVSYGMYRVIRPPYGELGKSVRGLLDCPVILWSVDTRDWTGKSAADIADYIVATAGEGDIILMHDIFNNSVRGALMAIDTMMENGYTFVTVEELFYHYGMTLEPGKIYRKASTGG